MEREKTFGRTLLETTANLSQNIIQGNAINMVVNSENFMSTDDLDKKLLELFRAAEKKIWEKKINRKNRIERIVSFHLANNRPHAHILVNLGTFSREKLKMILNLAFKEVFGRKSNDFTMFIKKNRTKVGASFYNNTPQLYDQDSINAFGSQSTFIKLNYDLKAESLIDERELIEKSLNRKLSNKTWNLEVKKRKKRANKEKNRLRRGRRISQQREEKKSDKHKQNNLAIA